MTFWQWGVISAAAALGAAIRMGLSRSFASSVTGFPLGTIVANGLGCIAIGIIWTYLDKIAAPEWVRFAIITGGLGSLTTFSTFAYESLKLIQSGDILTALLYSAGSVILGIVLVAIGASITGSLLQ